jgi:hypothetical protein
MSYIFLFSGLDGNMFILGDGRNTYECQKAKIMNVKKQKPFFECETHAV